MTKITFYLRIEVVLLKKNVPGYDETGYDF